MRKILASLVLMMLPWAARGQALADWYYWFDYDATPRDSGMVSDQAFRLEADVSNLSQGFHTLYVQVKDTAGTYSVPEGQMFYRVVDKSLQKLRYWFDSQTNVNDIPMPAGMVGIDVAQLEPGIHFINLQTTDYNGTMSNIETRCFYRAPISSNQKLYYWFLGDTIATLVPNFRDGFEIDVTRLKEGFNTLYVQMVDYAPSDIQHSLFIKVPQTENVKDMHVICVIDGEVAADEVVPSNGGIIKWDMDVSNISVGFHKAMFQVLTSSGTGSSIADAYFIRTLSSAEYAKMKCSYAIDGYKRYVQEGTLANGVFHFDLPVDEVEDGLHRLQYMLIAENGTTTQEGSAWFYKTPLGGNHICQYDYWLNNKSNEVQSVKLTEPQDPFQLIKLLPVTAEPIRSSCFHFENKNNEPKIYAKNDIHFRFHDASGRWVDADKQYVDYQLGQVVVPISELTEVFGEVTMERPDSNAIHWYTMECEEGDSLAVKASQATSIQVFSPSGEEVYSASGPTSVEYGGMHAHERGTFYIAVHDVTGSNNNMKLHYQIIDKFAVFEYTPSEFASKGRTTMYIKGNGLEYVKYLSLKHGQNIIEPDTLISSNTNLLALFTTNTILSNNEQYDLRISFNDEEKNETKEMLFEHAITLEPTQKGNIDVIVTRENRVADPYPVRVTIKNTGNTGYYCVPLSIAYDNVNKIDEFKFLDFDMVVSTELATNKSFFTYTDNLLGTGKEGFFMPILIPYLAPYEELTLTFGLKTKIAHATLNFYAWTGEPWMETLDNYIEGLKSSNTKDRRIRATASCEHSNIPDIYEPMDWLDRAFELMGLHINPGQIVKNSVGIGEAIGGIIQAGTRARDNAVLEAAGLDPNDPANDQYRFHYRYCARSPQEIGMDVFGPGADMLPNASSNCPDMPNPHPINIWIPGDPNEMTGYLAESGSRYIGSDVHTVGYDIEFENDPEIANASAHKIKIENMIDGNLFDLNSFCPKDITISGNKVELDGSIPCVTTIDLRPDIDAIGELRCDYNPQTGIAAWELTSLDPMSMEPTDDIMQGILPVNTNDGNGIGNVTYTVNLKDGLGDGTHVDNKASIVFDNNDAIETPTWTNIIDAIAPTSTITSCELKNDSTATLYIDATDNLSGAWKYDVYVQYGEGCSWFKAVEGDTSNVIDVKIYQDINQGFYVVATDSAGNVEVKTAEREFTLDLFSESDQTDIDYDLAAGWNWISHSFNQTLSPQLFSKNALRMVSQTEELIKDEQFGLIGNLSSLNSNECYKLQLSAPTELTIDGLIYRSAQKSVELFKGWNWIGYPLGNAMTPAQALSGFEASEGDCIIGQDGMAVYSAEDGWVGTLDTFSPGKGYMYKSDMKHRMTFNTEAKVSIRANMRKTANGTGWSCDSHKYPNIMALIAKLSKDGHSIEASDYVVAAFCGDECRGVAKNVNGRLMMNIYGEGGENIVFKAMDKNTGDVFDIAEEENFSAGLVGEYNSPYTLHIGRTTDIVPVNSYFGVEPTVVKDNMTVHLFGHAAERLTITNSNGANVMTIDNVADGQVLNLGKLAAGMYVVTVVCGDDTFNKKIVKID